jgi:integrase/recombinase XerD
LTETYSALFTTKAHNRLMPRALQYVVAELRERARMAKPVTCHSFRKNFGTHVAAGAGVRAAQMLLGHKRLNTVTIYTEVSRHDLAAAVERLAE